jgi:peptide subunit release factor 1 (eRF1)
MISYDDIRELQQYDSGGASYVLSLYVDVNQSKAANLHRGFETTVENLTRILASSAANANGGIEKYQAALEKVKAFFRDYTPRGKTLVLFCDPARGLWWQRELQVEVTTEARWSPKPWLRPLLDLLEGSERIAAVLIDKHRARILTVDATGVTQETEWISDVPARHVATGTDHIWSQAQMERDHNNHLKSHARRAVDELDALVKRKRLSRIMIGGPVEATSVFAAELPKRLQSMVVGTVPGPLDVTDDKLVSELRAVQQKIEHENDARMVEAMITAAKKGDRAVLGVADTLSAIQEGRVYRMVVARQYRTEGKECPSCRLLVTDSADECPGCGGELESAPDLVNRASHRVIEQAGRVQLVSGEAAKKLADEGMGAILRF